MKNALKRWFNSFRGGVAESVVRRHPRRLRPALETLEERAVPSSIPTVSLTAPSQAFIGATAPVSLGFSNTGDEPGYSPWAYVVLDATGHDGNDGVSFVANSASYLGASVTTVVATYDVNGNATGPTFARDPATDKPLTLTGGTPGNQVVFFQLPFGSFAAGQPTATVNFNVALSNQAYLGSPLSLQAGGGFALGNTPLDEGPPVDPSILGSTVTTSVTPTILNVTNNYNGTESETATGANFQHQYTIGVSIANGQTVNNLDVQDLLPDSIQFVSLDSAMVHGAAVTPAVLSAPSTATPGGNLSVGLGSVTGTGGDDADLTFTFYVPQDRTSPPNLANTPVLNLTTGAFASATSLASATASWTPLNPVEPAGTVSSNVAAQTLQEKSIATQKTVAVVGGGAVAPGATLQYTINFQVSDYFAFTNVVLPDLLGDGLRFDSGIAPTLVFSEQGGTASTGAFNPANYTVGAVNLTDGSQAITFNISNELTTRGSNGTLIGGAIPVGGTNGALPANGNPLPYGATQGTIVFYAVIQQNYSVETSPAPNDNPNVKQGDILTNTATVGGDVQSYTDAATPTGNRPVDNTAASVQVARGLLAKTIYAINGVAPTSANPQITVGDLVTYRLTYLLPTSTVENLKLTDYLPLPIFNVTLLGGSFGSTVDGSVPALNTAKFGPGVASLPAGFSVPAGTVDYSTLFGPAGQNLANYLPTISSDGPTNTVAFTFPKNLQDDPLQQTSLVDILFTVQIGSTPFADGLFLTNQANAVEGSTNNGTSQANNIVQIQLTEPNLAIQQGVVATNATGATFSSVTPAPLTFSAPGTVGSRFTGTIDSTNLAATPITSNLSGVQAGQLVTFAIVVQNDGTGRMGAFDVDVKDLIPAGFFVPTAGPGLNLQIIDGNGNAISYTTLAGGLFGSGIQLNDSGTNAGALAAFDPLNGNNIAIITYDLQAADSVQPDVTLPDTATLTNYTNIPNGTNFIPNGLTATASVMTPNVVPTKSVVTTSEPSTTGSDVAVGEVVRYRLVVQVPQSTAPDFQLQENLPAGLSFINDGTTTAALVSDDGGLVSSTLSGLNMVGDENTIGGIAPTFVLPSSAIEGTPFGDGTAPIFDFGTLTNSDRNNHLEYVVVEFNALVDNDTDYTDGTVVNNNFSVLVGGSDLATSPNVPVTIRTPVLSLTKTVSQATAQAGDTVNFSVTLTNTGSTTAFASTLSDTVPSFLTMTAAGVTYTTTGGATGVTNTSSGNNVALGIAILPAGATVTVNYSATVQAGVVPNQVLTDTTSVQANSLPGSNGTTSNSTGSPNTGAPGSGTGERTGSGVGPNDINATATKKVTIDTPVPVKYLVSTSESSTAGTNVTVGEVVRYRLVAEVPRSNLTAFQLDDLLPTGMSFLGGNTQLAFVSATGTAIQSTNLTLNAAGVVTTDVTTVTPSFGLDSVSGAIGTDANGHPVFNLGDLVNSGTGSAAEYVVVEFNALVDNVGTNTDGTPLNNTFEALVSGAQSGSVSNTIQTTVVEPNIANLKKKVVATTGDAGDTVTYTVTWSNTGDATAFNVNLADTLPTAETLTGTPSVVTTGTVGTVSTVGTSGNTVGVSLTSMNPGASVTVTYTATINTSVLPKQTINSSATLTYSSLPGTNGTTTNLTGGQTPGTPGTSTGERDGSGLLKPDKYVQTASAPLTVTAPTLTNSLFATSLPGTLGSSVNIDEQATYLLTATLNEGSFTSGLKLTDALPTGLTYVSSQIVSIGGQISGSALGVGASGTLTGSNVVFDLGSNVVDTPDNVSNANDQIVFEVVATVADVGPNFAGVGLIDSGTLNYGTGTTAPAPVTVTVVEPVLQLTKTAIGDTTLDANATATYQVVVSNPAGATAGDAFDLAITDPLPAGLSLVANSVTVLSAPAYAMTSVGSGTSVNVGVSELRAGDSVTIQYQAKVVAPPTATAPAPGATVVNTATVNYDSLPGPGGRVGPAASGSASITINSNTLSGDVYWDANHSGTFDASDTPITGSIRVQLTGNDTLGNAVNTTETTTTGFYQFTGLRPGTYTIHELDQPAGYLDYKDSAGNAGNPFGGTLGAFGVDTISAITIGADSNQTQPNYNFGKVKPVSIAGTFYEDVNANGTLETGEPGIGSIGVRLTGTDDLNNSITLNTTTAAVTGTFSFINLRPGTYTITETTQPSGYLDGKDVAGTAGGTVQPMPADQITAIPLVQTNATGYTFAKVKPASVAGFVYNDTNASGTKEAGEPGIGAVPVQLTGTNDLNQPVTLNTTSSSVDGSYSFANLRPGTYTVTEGTQPVGYAPGIDSRGSAGGTVAPLPATRVSNIVLLSGTAGGGNNFAETRPVANPDAATTVENTPLPLPTSFLLSNDTDAAGYPLAVISVSATSTHGGTVVLNGSVVTYNPPTGFHGSDTFTYTISDGHGGTSSTTVTIRVDAPPTTANNTVGMSENTSYTFKAADFPFQDPDVGDTLQALRINTLPALGSLTLNGVPVVAGTVLLPSQIGQLKYTPPLNQFALPLSSFTFAVSDGITYSTPATMFLNVWGPPTIAPVPDQINNNCTNFPLAYMGTFNDPANIGPFVGTVNYGDGTGVQHLIVNANGTFALSHNYTQRGVYEVDLTLTDGRNLTATSSFFMDAHFTGPQIYNSLITINDGSLQRSMVTSITVTFADHENLSAGAIQVTTASGQAVGTRLLTRDINGQTVVLVQFTDPTLIGGSLADGRYVFTLNSSDIHNSVGGVYNGGTAITDNFWRLFGDVNGTATVDNSDLADMQAALRSVDGTLPYRWYLDYDQNCTIDSVDYMAFLNRLGHSV